MTYCFANVFCRLNLYPFHYCLCAATNAMNFSFNQFLFNFAPFQALQNKHQLCFLPFFTKNNALMYGSTIIPIATNDLNFYLRFLQGFDVIVEFKPIGLQ